MNRRNSLEYNLSFAKKTKQKANTQRWCCSHRQKFTDLESQ